MQSSTVKNTATCPHFFLPFNYSLCTPFGSMSPPSTIISSSPLWNPSELTPSISTYQTPITSSSIISLPSTTVYQLSNTTQPSHISTALLLQFNLLSYIRLPISLALSTILISFDIPLRSQILNVVHLLISLPLIDISLMILSLYLLLLRMNQFPLYLLPLRMNQFLYLNLMIFQ